MEKISAGGVVIEDGMVLTLYVNGHDETVFPKGTIEVGESPDVAAVREVHEETGYHAQIICPLGSSRYEFDEDGNHYIKTVHFYLMKLIDENEKPNPQLQYYETFENQWLTTQDALNLLTHDANKEVLKKALELRSSL